MWKEIINIWTSDNLLSEAWELSYEAIALNQEMFKDAVEGLWGTKTKKTQKTVYKKDKLINKYEREIRRKVLTHLSIQGSTSLAPGLVLSTIIVDIERIGDYIKNIVELAQWHPDALEANGLKQLAAPLELKLKTMLSDLPRILEEGDEDAALEYYLENKEIGQTVDTIIEQIVRGSIEGLGPQCSAIMALYFRYLKRINAHLRNIVSSVINPFDRIGYDPKRK